MKKSGLWFLTIFLAFCLLLFWISFTYSSIARALPQIILPLTILFIVIEILNHLRTKGMGASVDAESPSVKKRLLITMGSTLIYLFAMHFIGYLISTALFLIWLMIFLRAKARLAMVLSTLLMLIFIWAAFFWWLGVQPPKSLIGF